MTSLEAPARGVPVAEQSDLRAYLGVLRRRKWTIVVVLLLVVGGVLAYSFTQTKQYTGTAVVLIQPSGAPPQLGGTNTTTLQPSDIQTQVQLITSSPVRAAVAQQLRGPAPDVSVNPVGQTDVIDIAATSTVPQQAARIANAYATSYVNFRRSQAVNSLVAAAQDVQAKILDLDRQIAALNDQVSSAPSSQKSSVQQSVTPQLNALSDQESALKTQLGQLQLSSTVQTGGSEVVTPAAVPTSPSSPRILRNALIAVAAGLLLGVGLAFVRDYLDDSVKTKDDLERAAGVPVLGLIPSVGNWKDPSTTRVASLVEPASHVAEAYRALRTSIQFAGMHRPIRRLQVTSPSAAEGKTATTANLGVALAAAGQRVTIVCCDLRRPRIHEFFGMSDGVGLTSVLLGQATAVEACQRVPHQDRLRVLASGPLPTNPSEVLQSAQTGAMLESLESEADILLLDCPPVLPVTDAAAVSRHVDATLLIVSAQGSHARVVARALEILGQVGAPVLGSVLNKVATDGAYGYPYKYRYYRPALHRTGLEDAYAQRNGQAHPEGMPRASMVSPTPPPPYPGSPPQHE